MLYNVTLINRINSAISDSISKEIFANRLLYSITGDKSYIRNVISCEGIGKKLSERLIGHNLIACCVNNRMKKIVASFFDLNWVAFTDNDPEICNLFGMKKIDRSEISSVYPDALVIIASIKVGKEVKNELLQYGIKEENIIMLNDYWEKIMEQQYFGLEELSLSEHETFVDCGAYDMFNSDQILHKCDKIYAFEPDQSNYHYCIKKYSDYIKNGKVEVLPYATFDKRTQLRFRSNQKGSSGLNNANGDTTVECVAIDEIINDNISFIKMDVEGAEYQSLLGAKNTIMKYHPKLAICVYHKKEDILKIPELVLDFDPSYKLYFRHYKFDEHETVMYAI